MAEGLNHWDFVIAAYAITIVGTVALTVSSLLTMRRAESRKNKARDQ